jgi:hypothetical protein
VVPLCSAVDDFLPRISRITRKEKIRGRIREIRDRIREIRGCIREIRGWFP